MAKVERCRYCGQEGVIPFCNCEQVVKVALFARVRKSLLAGEIEITDEELHRDLVSIDSDVELAEHLTEKQRAENARRAQERWEAGLQEHLIEVAREYEEVHPQPNPTAFGGSHQGSSGDDVLCRIFRPRSSELVRVLRDDTTR